MVNALDKSPSTTAIRDLKALHDSMDWHGIIASSFSAVMANVISSLHGSVSIVLGWTTFVSMVEVLSIKW